MKDPERFQKKGWEKISRCCKIAEQHGWEYIWIDTCCIDKDNLSELSEAINSMFRYYEDAGICYAYLEDVSSRDADGSTTMLEEMFRKSRWFTRGWVSNAMKPF